MSFFGFDTSLPREKPHNASAHGFGQAPDAFAGLSSHDYHEDQDGIIDFEDTYEGLDDADDAFNADTFGTGPVGQDFDFSGQTASISGLMPQSQSQARAPENRQPVSRQPGATSKPTKSGYEKYKEPDYIPKMEASASIWGQPTRTAPPPTQRQPVHQPEPEPDYSLESAASIANVTRKMMSLEEVEAMMRAQSRRSQPQAPSQPLQPIQSPPTRPFQTSINTNQDFQAAPRVLQRPQQMPPIQTPLSPLPPRDQIPSAMPQILLRQQQQGPPFEDRRAVPQAFQQQPLPPQPFDVQRNQQTGLHSRGPSYPGGPMNNHEQLLQMSADERRLFLEEDAKRAKRNHKIHLLSKNNGLMTPQDKNFITRIQLQQLLTATGNVDEGGPEAALAEDFYYQVYSQIRGPRMNPNQPLNQFAQTYLHQTSGRTGNRRYARGGDQIRRMEQQVQRAVEAAKLKPKNKQLVIEGSLGKISFSNAKTPKPLLNIKRADVDTRPRTHTTVGGRKATLRNVEALYSVLMKMEDHERRMPPQTTEESSADEIQEQIEWRATIQALNAELWSSLKVMEPIDQSKYVMHPFIAILSTPKGKKVLPRVFRQIDDQQRLTILTIVVIHLDMLDVIRLAQPSGGDAPLPLEVRNEIELFNQAVMPALFNYISEASLGVVVGLLGLIMERVNVPFIARTKIGLGLLTMLLSRADMVKDSGHAEAADLEQSTILHNALLDTVEPVLPQIFTTPVEVGDDRYVWQFLAALALCVANTQHQRLVMGVRDRVMATKTFAEQLPEEAKRQRLDTVNLFMTAIGLDVEWLA